MLRNPVGIRGYKHGLELYYIDERKFGIKPGYCHYVQNPLIFDDIILSLNSNFEVELEYATPWIYHFVYVEKPDIGSEINTIFYENSYPILDLKRGGFYHIENDARCIGAVFIGDGFIIPFEQVPRKHHSYNSVTGEIYRFTRKSNYILGFEDWRTDGVEYYEGNPLFTYDNRWTTFQFRPPFFGFSWENCNIGISILINITITRRTDCDIYVRKKQSNVDKSYNHINPHYKLFTLISSDEQVVPNENWQFIDFPYYGEFVVPINEYGEVELKSDRRAINILEYAATIGYVLPLFISQYDGFFPYKFRGIYEGFDISLLHDHTINIDSGKLHFAFPDGYGQLLDSIQANIVDSLTTQNWNYVYIKCPLQSSYIDQTNIYISYTDPINTEYGYYHPDLSINGKCIGAIRTDQYLNIIDIRSNTEHYPPDDCIFDCNTEVRFILETSHKREPYRLNKILDPWTIEYGLRGHDPTATFKHSSEIFSDYDHTLPYVHWRYNHYPTELSSYDPAFSNLTNDFILPLIKGPYNTRIEPKDYWYCWSDKNDEFNCSITELLSLIRNYSPIETSRLSKIIDFTQWYKLTYYVWKPMIQPGKLISGKWEYDIDYKAWESREGFTWNCFSPSELNLPNNYIVYRAQVEDDWVECIHINDIHYLAYTRLENTSYGLGLVIDEWDICDDRLHDDGAYLIVNKRKEDHGITEFVCDFSIPKPVHRCYLDPYDEGDMYHFNNKLHPNHLETIHPNPLEVYNYELLYDLNHIKRVPLLGGKIARHTEVNIINILDAYFYYPYVYVLFDFLHENIFKTPYENTTYEDCELLDFWYNHDTWDEVECISEEDSTSFYSLFDSLTYNRPYIDDILQFRLFDDQCNSLEVMKMEKVYVDKSVSFLIDYCYDDHIVPDTTSLDTTSFDSTSFCQFNECKNVCIEYIPNIQSNILEFCQKFPQTTEYRFTDMSESSTTENTYYKTCFDSDWIKIQTNPILFEYSQPDYISAGLYHLRHLWTNSPNDRDVYVIFIGKKYTESVSEYWANNRSFIRPHPFLLHELLHWYKYNRIHCYAITEEYSQDLEFLCDGSGGLYQTAKLSDISIELNNIFQHIEELGKYQYKINFIPKQFDNDVHSVVIKTIGPLFATAEVSFIPHEPVAGCDFKGIL